jgi:hypothetical protein
MGAGVQLVIEHGAAPYWWESPAIWVVPGTDPLGQAGTPIVGQTAFLWATVTNQGDTPVENVQVDFWVADPSTQILKSTANHIGTAFTNLGTGANNSQQVVCLTPWHVTYFNGGHECVVVEASSPSDPLNPTPSNPDVLDADTYPQIGQLNLWLSEVGGRFKQLEGLIGISRNARGDRVIRVEALTEGRLAPVILKRLGLDVREVNPDRVVASLRDGAVFGTGPHEGQKSIELHLKRGTSGAVCLTYGVKEDLKAGEYGLVRIVALEGAKMVGGVSVIVVGERRKKGKSL